MQLLDEQTAITDPEHAVLAGAVKGLKDLQNSIHSNRQCAMQLLGVQNRIQGFKGIVAPGRVFIAEGPLSLLESGVKSDGYVFLFNNMLVFCSPGVAPPQQGAVPQYRFKMKITIDGSVTVKDNSSNPTEPAPRHSIQVSTTTDQKNFVFIAPKASKKDEWIQHLDSAIYHGSQSKSFGMRLAHLLKREGRESGVPRVVENAIKHLDEHALNVEGLFRISPSAFATNQIKEAIDSGVPVDFASVDNHIVALLLKLFFRYPFSSSSFIPFFLFIPP
jgi:hypothetical protein